MQYSSSNRVRDFLFEFPVFVFFKEKKEQQKKSADE